MSEATAQIIIVAIITAMPGVLAFLAQIRTDANKGLRELVDALQKRIEDVEKDVEEERVRANEAELEKVKLTGLLADTKEQLEKANAALANFSASDRTIRNELRKYKLWGVEARKAMVKAGIDVPRFPDTGELTEPLG